MENVGIIKLMFKEIYLRSLAKDKLLRHMFQHLEVTVLVAGLLYFVTGKAYTRSDLVIFLIFTYLPDIDGLSLVFFWHKSNATAQVIYGYITKFKFKEALAYGTMYHKNLNRLILHNIVVYILLWVLLLRLINSENFVYTIVVATMLGHFTFDILDDVYQLKHVNNWLWPVRFVMKWG